MITEILNRLEVLAGVDSEIEEARGLSEENFKALSPTQQIKYIKEHPHSKYGRDPKWLKRAKMLKTRMLNMKKAKLAKGVEKKPVKENKKSSSVKGDDKKAIKAILSKSKNKLCRAFKDVDFDKLKQLQKDMLEEDKQNEGKSWKDQSYKASNTFMDYLDKNLDGDLLEKHSGKRGSGTFHSSEWFGDEFGNDYDIDKLKNNLLKKAGGPSSSDKNEKHIKLAVEKIKSFKPTPQQIKKCEQTAEWYKDHAGPHRSYHFTGKDRAFAENLFKEYTKLDSKIDPDDNSKGVASIEAISPILNKLSHGKIAAFQSILEEENWHTALDEVDSRWG